MNWEKLKKNHYNKDPVEYIYSQTIFDMKEYDDLYENQNNMSHKVWKDLSKKYGIKFKFLKDIRDFDKDKDVICLWFFKDRGDKTAGEYIKIAGHIITYYTNTFLITQSKDILIREKGFIYRPALQLDLPNSVYEEILERFSKVTAPTE